MKKDYWKDRKYLNYDMKIEFDIPKNMKYIIDLLENLYFNIIMALILSMMLGLMHYYLLLNKIYFGDK